MGTLGQVGILINDGTGNFNRLPDVDAGTQIEALALGDLDGDGQLDVAAYDQEAIGQGRVVLLRNAGGGNLQLEGNFQTPSTLDALILTDLDQNGRLDLVATVNGFFAVAVWPGTGATGFGEPSFYGTDGNPQGVASGDLNGDGLPDLVTGNAAEQTLQALLQRQP